MSNENNKISIYLKEKGFVYSGSEIYGGLSNTWDYGPLGSILKSNIKNYWKKKFIDESYDIKIFHLDSSIILNSKIWKSSGHLEKFNDPLIDCKTCKSRYRADELIDDFSRNKDSFSTNDEMTNYIHKNIKCLKCGNNTNWTNVRTFELMFSTFTSKTSEDKSAKLYFRPETAQGAFINFNNILRTQNAKIPFGVGQIGKSFRNEITPGNFIFRTKRIWANGIRNIS